VFGSPLGALGGVIVLTISSLVQDYSAGKTIAELAPALPQFVFLFLPMMMMASYFFGLVPATLSGFALEAWIIDQEAKGSSAKSRIILTTIVGTLIATVITFACFSVWELSRNLDYFKSDNLTISACLGSSGGFLGTLVRLHLPRFMLSRINSTGIA
jgi:hypothetical protein